MVLPHFAGAPEQSQDEMVTTHPFHEVSLRLNYRFPVANRYRINLLPDLKIFSIPTKPILIAVKTGIVITYTVLLNPDPFYRNEMGDLK